jgi:hypothetical protein
MPHAEVGRAGVGGCSNGRPREGRLRRRRCHSQLTAAGAVDPEDEVVSGRQIRAKGDVFGRAAGGGVGEGGMGEMETSPTAGPEMVPVTRFGPSSCSGPIAPLAKVTPLESVPLWTSSVPPSSISIWPEPPSELAAKISRLPAPPTEIVPSTAQKDHFQNCRRRLSSLRHQADHVLPGPATQRVAPSRVIDHR